MKKCKLFSIFVFMGIIATALAAVYLSKEYLFSFFTDDEIDWDEDDEEVEVVEVPIKEAEETPAPAKEKEKSSKVRRGYTSLKFHDAEN